MCGLVFALSEKPVERFVRVAHERQRHRGPDGEGLHFENIESSYLGMAHQRLSIVDLSDNGKQPMLSASGRYRILFNGEIYNFRELAKQYGLSNLKSGTDTEVVVELVEKLGVEHACQLFNGMWAMVIQDRKVNRYHVARDRFGKKPLYILHNQDSLFIASEMHSLLGVDGFELKPDKVTAMHFLSQSLQNIDNRSWVEGVSVFPPAAIGEIDGFNLINGITNITKYWEPDFHSSAPERSFSESVEELKYLVGDAIKLRLNADVPVGIALSGGLDSSIIAHQASNKSSEYGERIEVFSAVSPGSSDDESEHIDVMQKHLNLDVQRYDLTRDKSQDLHDLMQECIRFADGPISSFSTLLFYKLMEKAKAADVTVILTGQGADEVFCGYRKYPILEIKRLLKNKHFKEAASLGASFLKNGTLVQEFKLDEAKRYFGSSNKPILGDAVLEVLDVQQLARVSSLEERQWLDISKYSVPYLCHYEDRMSMACSREVRSPFLDYRLVEFGLKLNERSKIANGWTKYALRKAFERELPASIVWRKDKKGFSNPQDAWMKGGVQQVVREVMNDSSALVYQFGLVDKNGFLELFDSYCAGRGNVWFRDVFAPFSLELWLRSALVIQSELRK